MKKPARKTAASPSAAGRPVPGQVRLIGGRWRGSKLAVADAAGLRPTSDRVRETLFNWLAPVLPGARVLDLFAGSGALGFEALSRGAAAAVLVERDRALAEGLLATSRRLPGGEAASVVQADALAWLPTPPRGSVDIAVGDPPVAAGRWHDVLPALLPLMSEGAWLYLETPAEARLAAPTGWDMHREGRTREVSYALYRRQPASRSTPADTLPGEPAGPDGRLIEPVSE